MGNKCCKISDLDNFCAAYKNSEFLPYFSNILTKFSIIYECLLDIFLKVLWIFTRFLKKSTTFIRFFKKKKNYEF